MAALSSDESKNRTPARWELLARELLSDRVAVGAGFVLLLLVLAAAFAPWVMPQNPYDLRQISILDNMLPPLSEVSEGGVYLLGTDEAGRDMLSAMFFGVRLSLIVAASATALAFLIGVSAGLVAAYVGGKVDATIMRLVDIQFAIPSILIALILLSTLGRGIDKVIVALVAVQWAYYARTVRANALAELQRDYMTAARCLALPRYRILRAHLLPNCLPPLIVVATVQIAHAIALEATLSFLGIGVPVTEPSLGLLIAKGYSYLLSGQYWVSVFPGLLLVVLILSINLLADRLRELLNPRLQA